MKVILYLIHMIGEINRKGISINQIFKKMFMLVIF